MEKINAPIPILGTRKKPGKREQIRELQRQLSLARFAADSVAQAYAWKDLHKDTIEIRAEGIHFRVFCLPTDNNDITEPTAICSPCATPAEAIVFVYLEKKKQQEAEMLEKAEAAQAELDKKAAGE